MNPYRAFLLGMLTVLLALRVSAWVQNRRVMAEFRARAEARGAAAAESIHAMAGGDG